MPQFLFVKGSRTQPASVPVNLRCPACGQLGTFDHLAHDLTDVAIGEALVGSRVCPNRDCRLHVFTARNGAGEVVATYPAERISFDTSNIPSRIAQTFDEALACHSERLYVAAAIMLRRTLEELCQDKNASGDNLKKRIAALQSAIVLPQGLLDALDDLRLLGNDAAHVEAQTYEEIGEEELNVAIELTKEILKAVYQYSDLLGRLRALKKGAVK